MSDFLFNEEAHPNAAIANRILKDYRRDHPKRITQHVNPTPLLCRAAVRTFLLDLAKQERQFHKFTRVSEETLLAAQGTLRSFLVNHVKRMPSKGRTL